MTRQSAQSFTASAPRVTGMSAGRLYPSSGWAMYANAERSWSRRATWRVESPSAGYFLNLHLHRISRTLEKSRIREMRFCGEQNMNDFADQGDTGPAPPLDLTLLIVKCVAAGALFTAAAWLVISYALDWVTFR